MADNENLKDRRKFQRVRVEASPKNLDVEVIGYGKTLVFDMSYTGAAIKQPQERKILNPDEAIVLRIKTEVDEAQIQAKVIRVNQDIVALEFEKIGVPARIIIDRVVTDRIVGINMTFVEPKHYNSKADFTHWFHGPKETNLYLWWAQERLFKAQMDMENCLLFLELNHFYFENKINLPADLTKLNNSQIALKALAIVEQIEKDIKPLSEFKKILKSHVYA
jgi:hypothetical protein